MKTNHTNLPQLFAGFCIALFALVSHQIIVAQQDNSGSIRLSINPSIETEGRIYFSGDEYRSLSNPQTTGYWDDAYGNLDFQGDYLDQYGNALGGVVLETSGSLSSSAASFGLGDNAYAYIHLLQAFGIVDWNWFDLYLQGGRFEASLGNAQDAGDNDFKAEVDALGRDNKITMQVDMIIANMLTLRSAYGFAPFEKHDSLAHDIGFGLLFDHSFGGMHNIQASVAYTLDLTNNLGNDQNGNEKVGTAWREVKNEQEKEFYRKYGPSYDESDGSYYVRDPNDFDNLGFSLAYTADIGRLQLMPFFNLEFQGVFADAAYAYTNPYIGWSAGLWLEVADRSNRYTILTVGLDLGGWARENDNYTSHKYVLDSPGTCSIKESYGGCDRTGATETVKWPHIANEGFKGFGIWLQTDALQAVMGDNYLRPWVWAQFHFNDPKKFGAYDISREGYLNYFGVNLTQYLVNTNEATVYLDIEFALYNIAPYYLEGVGYLGAVPALAKLSNPTVKHAAFQTYIDIGLNADFSIDYIHSFKK